jgi:two-component system, OmpR family, response regulator CpxR
MEMTWTNMSPSASSRDLPVKFETSLLLVDDDAELCSLMADFFTQRGFKMEAVHDGRRGLARALDGNFNLILLDVMMPGLDGFELLRQLRRRSSTPVIMLTARTEPADRVMGLNSGADDYLPKPFGPEELLARIQAVLRRTQKTAYQPDVLEVNGVRINPGTREVWLDRLPVEVTSIEYDILDLLMRSAGRPVSRDQLSAVLYQREASPFDRSVDVHVSHLRKKLEQKDRALIKTVRGVGYLFCSERESPEP